MVENTCEWVSMGAVRYRDTRTKQNKVARGRRGCCECSRAMVGTFLESFELSGRVLPHLGSDLIPAVCPPGVSSPDPRVQMPF